MLIEDLVSVADKDNCGPRASKRSKRQKMSWRPTRLILLTSRAPQLAKDLRWHSKCLQQASVDSEFHRIQNSNWGLPEPI